MSNAPIKASTLGGPNCIPKFILVYSILHVVAVSLFWQMLKVFTNLKGVLLVCLFFILARQRYFMKKTKLFILCNF